MVNKYNKQLPHKLFKLFILVFCSEKGGGGVWQTWMKFSNNTTYRERLITMTPILRYTFWVDLVSDRHLRSITSRNRRCLISKFRPIQLCSIIFFLYLYMIKCVFSDLRYSLKTSNNKTVKDDVNLIMWKWCYTPLILIPWHVHAFYWDHLQF